MKNNINTLLDNIEIHSGKKLNFRTYISLLIETSKTKNLKKEFDNLIFLGKFIFNAIRILNQKSMDIENYKNLIREYENNLVSFKQSLKCISDNIDLIERSEFQNLFFVKNNITELFLLIEDLKNIKNYEIDNKIEVV